jgi:F1F0 ATPase subunit 2
MGVTIVLFTLLGFAAGAIHFAMLRRNVKLMIRGGSIAVALATALGRFALTVLIFVVVAMSHGLVLLWTLGGFVLARIAAVRIIWAEA